jgi:hypothetical protein
MIQILSSNQIPAGSHEEGGQERTTQREKRFKKGEDIYPLSCFQREGMGLE